MTAPLQTARNQTIVRTFRGVASVEAVIVIPIFMILLVSLYYVKDQILAQQAADIHARYCAWAFSANSCDVVPPGCENVVGVGSEGGEIRQEVSDQLDKMSLGLVKGAVMAILDPALRAAFGRSLDANTQKSFGRPALCGGGAATIRGHYHLACNIAVRAPEEVAWSIWDAIF